MRSSVVGARSLKVPCARSGAPGTTSTWGTWGLGMGEQRVTAELAARARRHFVEGAEIVAEYERASSSIHDREQVAEAGRFFVAGHDLLRLVEQSHGHVVDLRAWDHDAAERLSE